MKIRSPVLNYVMMSFCLILMSGCTTTYNLAQSGLSWDEFQEYNVSFGNSVWDEGKLNVPTNFTSQTGDSLHVMFFKTRVENDTIYVTGYRKLPDKNPGQANNIIVSLPDPISARYRIVYKSPDGTEKYIQGLEIPDKQ